MIPWGLVDYVCGTTELVMLKVVFRSFGALVIFSEIFLQSCFFYTYRSFFQESLSLFPVAFYTKSFLLQF